jgi:hypothetical protein
LGAREPGRGKLAEDFLLGDLLTREAANFLLRARLGVGRVG